MNYYNVDGVEYVSHGCWNDAELCYKGVLIPEPDIAQTLWENFVEDTHSASLGEFDSWCLNNPSEIIEAVENYVFYLNECFEPMHYLDFKQLCLDYINKDIKIPTDNNLAEYVQEVYDDTAYSGVYDFESDFNQSVREQYLNYKRQYAVL